jgi:hypothetical protein
MKYNRFHKCNLLFYTHREAYEEYLAETRPSFGLDRRNEETGEVQQPTWPDCHETYFYRVWDADHPDLKLRAYNRFMVSP